MTIQCSLSSVTKMANRLRISTKLLNVIRTFRICEMDSSKEMEGTFFRWNMAVSSTSKGVAADGPSLESAELCRSKTGLFVAT